MLAFIDWNKLEWPQYLAIGGGVVLALALLLYFLGSRVREGLRVPAVMAGIVGGLAVGLAVGVLGMARFGYEVKKPKAKEESEDPRANPMVQSGRGGMPGGGMPGGGMPGGGMPGGGMPGRGPNPKQQLVGLVSKLNVLTDKPLAVTLSPEQKEKVLEQLQGLDKPEELKDDEAKKRLGELLKDLKPHKATLEAAGYRWPSEDGPGRGGQPQPPPANPFKAKENGATLKSLEQRLKKSVEH